MFWNQIYLKRKRSGVDFVVSVQRSRENRMIHVIFGIGTSNQICGSKKLFLDFDEPITKNVTFKVSITQMKFL